jgi:arsenate reductase
MKVSELARLAGLSPSGVRWYEAAGVLPEPARQPNGYREYTESDLARLSLIITLRQLGLPPSAAGRIVGRLVEGGPIDDELERLIHAQRQSIAQRRLDLDRIEAALSDLDTTIGAGRAGKERGKRHPKPTSVLFICDGNSARSQMAEALLARLGGNDFAVASAGIRPRRLNPLVVRVLAEVGIDWGAAHAKPVAEMGTSQFDYVITLSDSARANCPSLPGPNNSLHWHLPDPSATHGPEENRLGALRRTRAELSIRLRPFIEIARRASGL